MNGSIIRKDDRVVRFHLKPFRSGVAFCLTGKKYTTYKTEV